jgi:hypothetical protein
MDNRKEGARGPRISVFSSGEEIKRAFDELMIVVRNAEGRPDNEYSETVEHLLISQQDSIMDLVKTIRKLAFLVVAFAMLTFLEMAYIVIKLN